MGGGTAAACAERPCSVMRGAKSRKQQSDGQYPPAPESSVAFFASHTTSRPSMRLTSSHTELSSAPEARYLNTASVDVPGECGSNAQ